MSFFGTGQKHIHGNLLKPECCADFNGVLIHVASAPHYVNMCLQRLPRVSVLKTWRIYSKIANHVHTVPKTLEASQNMLSV